MTPRSRAFTLVELLLVVFLLAAVAATTASLATQADEQFRYDDTKARREEIRRAIVGDQARAVLGQPVVSGFVADMGRLPRTLDELYRPPGEWTPAEPGWAWQPASSPLHQAAGWRGPYLRPDQEATGPAYRDGWRNLAVGSEDPRNAGWSWDPTSQPLFGLLRSKGSDGVTDGLPPPTSLYAQDSPASGALIEPGDHLVDLRGLRVRVEYSTTTPPPPGTVLRLRLVVPGSGLTPLLQAWPPTNPDATAWLSRAHTVAAAEPGFEFEFDGASPWDTQPRWVAYGLRSLVVIDEADGAPLGQARPLLLLPRSSLPDLVSTPFLTGVPSP